MNPLLGYAEDSLETSSLFSAKDMSGKNVSSAAILLGSLRVSQVTLVTLKRGNPEIRLILFCIVLTSDEGIIWG